MHLKYIMNKGLASILLSNLLKNAIVHGKKKSDIEIVIAGNNFTIYNTGHNGALDSEKVFSRFQKNTDYKASTGIGLAIAKTIAGKYGLQLIYSYDQRHSFQLHFPK